MGGTKILGCLLNSSGDIIQRVKTATDTSNGAERYTEDIAKLISEILEKSGIKTDQIKAVALGVPGSLDPFSGIIKLAPNLNISNYNIKKSLDKILPMKVFVENDVNLGALGIKNFGVGKEAKNMLAVFIGTGIGGGLILNEKIYRGSSFSAGEIGHFVIQKDGPVCGCGNRGCIEAVASRTAIVKNIIEDINEGKKSVLKKPVMEGKKIKSGILATAVKQNDEVTIRRISEACDKLGILLGGITNLLNLDLIVLGGGLIEALDYFMLPLIKDSMKRSTMKDPFKTVSLKASRLGDDAAIYGGIALVREFSGEDF
ncbi:MAG: glucokinase [Ignavibacteriaceae bacterium]